MNIRLHTNSYKELLGVVLVRACFWRHAGTHLQLRVNDADRDNAAAEGCDIGPSVWSDTRDFNELTCLQQRRKGRGV